MYHHPSKACITTPPVGQESRHRLAGYLLRVSHPLQSSVSKDYCLIIRLTLSGFASKITHMEVGRPQILLTVGWTLFFLVMWASRRRGRSMGAVSPQSECTRECVAKTHLTLELRSHPICHIQHVSRSSHKIQPTLRRGLHKDLNTRSWDQHSSPRGCLPQ